MTSLCLAIETAGAYLGLSLCRLDDPSAAAVTVFERRPGEQSDLLIPTLETQLKKRRWSRSDLSLIAVDVGPGSFTGVRVGVAAARGLAQGLNRPIAGVNGLEAMAWASTAEAGELVLAARPALEKEIYFAVYEIERRSGRRHARERLAPAWLLIDEAERLVKRRFGSRTKGRALLAEPPRSGRRAEFRAFPWAPGEHPPHPEAIARIAMGEPGRSSTSIRAVEPLYLQPSWAERTARTSKR